MKEKHQINMLEGSLADKIFLFALPLALSSILQQLFNSADLAVVGRFSSSAAMAAVGSNSSVINLLVSLLTGLSVGANVSAATLIGQKQKEKLHEAVQTSMALALISGLIMMVVCLVVARPILEMMNAPKDVLNLAILYLRIYALALPFIVVYDFGASLLRAKGDSRRPLYCLLASGILNVFLNLFFVIIVGMSVDGVATATVISNILSAGMVVYFLMHEEDSMHFDPFHPELRKDMLKQIMQIGIPAGLQGMVFSLSNVVIQSGINSFGADAIAGSTAGQNFEFMAFYVVNAFGQAAVTFTSQNYGAKEYDRCKKVYRISMLYGEFITLGLSMIFWFGRYFFLSFFTTDPNVVQYACVRMFFISNLELMTGTYEIAGGCLRGMGKSMLPTVITLLGSCAFRLVYVYTVFAWNHQFQVLMWAYPITWTITGSAMLFSYFKLRKSLFENQ
ncbi:MAG: MATE family efflux transporter [Erysipelotrichaceae bacterium]|nr:MATE family efflux transporter [Erysipelotrichaceae bacterium]